MTTKKYFLHCFVVCMSSILFSCSVFKKNGIEELNSGVYGISFPAAKIKKGYVEVRDSSLKIYSIFKNGFTDTTNVSSWGLNEFLTAEKPLRLSMGSFDIDVLTIPFKFRPSVNGFPNQLNTNFSGALYAGYRTDRYLVRYKKDPLRKYSRKENHLGYSVGIFSGFGSTAMNPWVTDNFISSEYDGLVWLNGVAGIIAVNNFSFGVGLGIDNLLDKNKDAWIYNNKPWIGLTVGLNLN